MDKKSKRVGIMGGTFNPVHIGHLLIAEQSYREYELDHVIFMPAGHPPHKQDQEIVSNHDRLAMLRLAVEGVPYFRVSDYEINKHGLSYTYETLEYLTGIAPDTRFYFIMGADSVKDLTHWCRPERILELAHILAAVRGDTDMEMLNREAELLRCTYQAKISLLGAPELDISSRELRDRVKNYASIRFMVPEKVNFYIHFHHLYEKSNTPPQADGAWK